MQYATTPRANPASGKGGVSKGRVGKSRTEQDANSDNGMFDRSLVIPSFTRPAYLDDSADGRGFDFEQRA